MSKLIPTLLLIASFFCPTVIKADDYADGCCENTGFCFDGCCEQGSIAAKYAAFFPLSPKMRRIYVSALPAFTLEGNVKICSYGCGDWYVWLDGSYIFTNGRARGYGCNTTHLNLVPISLGAKYVYHFCPNFDIYFGLGPMYSFLNIRDHSRFVHKKTSADNSGAIVKSGFVYNYCDCVYFEGFLNYTYQKFYFHKHEDCPYVERNDADLSSIQLGVGIGWTF